MTDLVVVFALFVFMFVLFVLLGGSVAELDSGAEGPGFKSQSRRSRVTVLGKLLTPIVPLCSPSSKIGSSSTFLLLCFSAATVSRRIKICIKREKACLRSVTLGVKW